MPKLSHLGTPARLLVVVVAIVAIVLGFAGVSTYVVERRAAALAAGGLEFSRLDYNPFSGRLTLDDVRARNGDARAVFTAERITARLAAGSLFGTAMKLDRLSVVSPTLRLKAAPQSVVRLVSDEPTTLGWLPVELDDVAISDGVIVIDGAGAETRAIVIRHIDARFGRVAEASLDRGAFAVAMEAYGATVGVRGQPIEGPGDGYLIRIHGDGLDLARVFRDLVPAAPAAIAGPARGDVDAQIRLSDGRIAVSGQIRSGPLVIDPTADGTCPVDVAGLTAVIERFDPVAWTGRLSRLEVRAPRLTLRRDADGSVRIPTVDRALLAAASGITVRRLAATDGTIVLADPNGRSEMRITGIQMSAKWNERAAGRPVDLMAYASAGGGSLSLTGGLDFDRGFGHATMNLQRLPVAMWRRALSALDGPTDGWLFFDGTVALVLGEDASRARVTGRVALLAPAFGAPDGERDELRAESIVVDVHPEPALSNTRVTITATPVRGEPLTFAYVYPLSARVRGEGIELGVLLGDVGNAARDTRRRPPGPPS